MHTTDQAGTQPTRTRDSTHANPGLDPREPGTRPARRSDGSAPDVRRDVDDGTDLGPLLLVGEDVALLRGGEAALRAERELLERDEGARVVDAVLDRVRVLEGAVLGGQQAEHDRLVAPG